jgi:UDP-N-acetylmuramoylalanine--D-glutamate ligase
MKVAILGYGVEGQAALTYWQNQGHEITICDANPNLKLPSGIKTQLGPDYLSNLSHFDLVVRSPGIKPSQVKAANITSVTNEFLEECPAKIIGVTGTKGKGTTTTLIAKILEAAGHTVHLGGNIGTPALNLLPDIEPEDWVILELSSFQLMDARRSPHIAVMLMIATDHQDWHPNMAEYVAAKQQIFAHQGPGDLAIYNACNLASLESGLGAPADQLPYNARDGAWVDLESSTIKMGDTIICKTSDIALPGRHNWDNVCAAVAATWPIVQDAKPIKQAISGFTGLEHRLEKVATVNGVTYIDDSYSTNSETAIAAIQAYAEPKVLILGGSDKEASFDRLAEAVVRGDVRTAILIGATAPKLKVALKNVGYDQIQEGPATMPGIVRLAAAAAKPGDVVLLSPACASFDLFPNYKERGRLFAAAAKALL